MLLAQAARKKARREGAGIAGGAVVNTLAHGPAAVQEDTRIVRVSPREEQPAAPISPGDSTTSSEDKDAAASIDAMAPSRSRSSTFAPIAVMKKTTFRRRGRCECRRTM